MTFHSDILLDSIPPFFNPPLEYQRETNSNDPSKPSNRGALEKPDQGQDQKMRAYPDHTNIDSHRLRKQQASTLHSRRALTVWGIKNLYPDRLTVSYMQGHSARELCANKMSLRLDFVLIAEGAFCDMETATLWPLCTTI
jgi:hypothetical protein